MMRNFNKKVTKMRKIFDIPSFFKIDFSFFALLILAWFLEEVRFYFIYVVFILLHELSHYVVAKKLKYLPERVHLTFFGASLEGYDDFNFYDEIKIVLAGPLFNLMMVILCYVSFWFFPETSVLFYDILIANFSILIFNILPIFPLDMGRFLLAHYSKKISRFDAVKKVKTISIAFVCFMFCVFLISFFFNFNFTLGFVCVNLAILTLSTSKSTSFKRHFFVFDKLKKIKKGLFEKTVYVDLEMKNFELFKFIDNSHYFKFVFLDESGSKVKEISEIELYRECDLI